MWSIWGFTPPSSIYLTYFRQNASILRDIFFKECAISSKIHWPKHIKNHMIRISRTFSEWPSGKKRYLILFTTTNKAVFVFVCVAWFARCDIFDVELKGPCTKTKYAIFFLLLKYANYSFILSLQGNIYKLIILWKVPMQ